MRVFSKELAVHINCPEYWHFSFSPSSKYCGLLSFRIDLFDLLAAQGTLKSLLQYHNSKASILGCSAFFESLICAEILHLLTINPNYKSTIGIIITPSLHMRKLKWKNLSNMLKVTLRVNGGVRAWIQILTTFDSYHGASFYFNF